MEKKIIVFCVASCIILVGVICGIKVYSVMAEPNSVIASVAGKNKQVSAPGITATSQPLKKEVQSLHNVEPIPDLVTLMLATPEKK